MNIEDVKVGSKFTVPDGYIRDQNVRGTWVKGRRKRAGSWGYYEASYECWNETDLWMRMFSEGEVVELVPFHILEPET